MKDRDVTAEDRLTVLFQPDTLLPVQYFDRLRRRTEYNGERRLLIAVLDRSAILTGSYNWTHAADRLNDENLLLFRDAGLLAEEYRRIFVQLWERKN